MLVKNEKWNSTSCSGVGANWIMKKADPLLGDNCVFSSGCTRCSVGAWIRQRIATDNELSLIMGDSTLRFFASHLQTREGVGVGLITVLQKNRTAPSPSELMQSPNQPWQEVTTKTVCILNIPKQRKVKDSKTEDIYDWRTHIHGSFFLFHCGDTVIPIWAFSLEIQVTKPVRYNLALTVDTIHHILYWCFKNEVLDRFVQKFSPNMSGMPLSADRMEIKPWTSKQKCMWMWAEVDLDSNQVLAEIWQERTYQK